MPLANFKIQALHRLGFLICTNNMKYLLKSEDDPQDCTLSISILHILSPLEATVSTSTLDLFASGVGDNDPRYYPQYRKENHIIDMMCLLRFAL